MSPSSAKPQALIRRQGSFQTEQHGLRRLQGLPHARPSRSARRDPRTRPLGGLLVAELLDEPRLGPFTALYAIGLVGGIFLGAVAGWYETRSWGSSLKEGWSGWMHAAVGAGTMGEAARRAGAIRLAPWRLLTVFLLTLNLVCLVAAWFALPSLTVTDAYGLLAVGTVAITGAALGAFLTVRFAEALWCRSVEHQTLELVRSGKLGVWGIR